MLDSAPGLWVPAAELPSVWVSWLGGACGHSPPAHLRLEPCSVIREANPGQKLKVLWHTGVDSGAKLGNVV